MAIFSGTMQVSQCQKKSSGLDGEREDIRGRHTDNLAGRYSIQTNQRPTSIIPFLHQMPFLPQPSKFILAWNRQQICWLAYPVAWLYPVAWFYAEAWFYPNALNSYCQRCVIWHCWLVDRKGIQTTTTNPSYNKDSLLEDLAELE